MERDFPTDYQTFIHRSRYARWSDSLKRRENWHETVERYFNFFYKHLADNVNYIVKFSDNPGELFQAVLNLEIMPSMRCLMSAGRALARDNVCGYNCCYLPINHLRSFDELLFILMCGTGVGFSVERQEISQLPEVPPELRPADVTIIVRDSKRGWSEALRQLLSHLYKGDIPKWDVSAIRPAGSRLKTMGGRSSGPGPLTELFKFCVALFGAAKGRKLTSLECHDLACKIADCVVVGGVRRSALLSLSNLSDLRMREAKAGQWWTESPWRALANNSVAYSERPQVGQFMEEWLALYRSKSGERGIFNRQAITSQVASVGRRDSNHQFGTNPCSEIILRPREFCNLSEVVARPDDDFDSLARKVKLATILGTWQSTLTKFRYISREFQRNCEEERLLGVSITGIMDCPLLCKMDNCTAQLWHELKQIAIMTNRSWADKLEIPRSAAITCVKPSGTVSQLVDAASGIHPRFAPFYLRRVRQDKKDPLTTFLMEAKIPHVTDPLNPSHVVFSFPQKSPAGAIVRAELPALEHLRLWRFIQQHFCEHKPSITVMVRESEWPSVGGWAWDNFDHLTGVAFLPYSDHSYQLAPYEEISQERYLEELTKMPQAIDWESLAAFEDTDNTTNTKELACTAGQCEL